MAVMPAREPMTPIDPRSRLKSADAVRGFALFGVLLVNMYNFGAYSPEWTGTVDRIFAWCMHFVFETKSLRLFALLFGFGFALQMAKSVTAGVGKYWFYYRRLAVLFVFGVGHALFFDGDILMEYALLGCFLPLVSRLRTGILLALAVLLLAAFPIGNLVESLHEGGPAWDPEDSMTLVQLRAGHPYLGSLRDVFEENAAVIPPRIWAKLHGPESSLAIFAMFLIGFCIGRSRIVHDADRHAAGIGKLFRWCAVAGITFAFFEWLLNWRFGYAVFEGNTATIPIQLLGDLLFAYGSTALALAYGSGIVLLAQQPAWNPVLEPFQALGKMALTVYLSGTAMSTLLFYGYGFGQLYLLGPAATTAYAVLFFAIQVGFCNWWLARYRFGPAEWLWRSLSYMKWQPIRTAA